MRIAVLSDVHSNLPALDAVLRHANHGGTIDALWVTGDLVGYGAQPADVLARLRDHALIAVAGNHDLVGAGVMGVEEFNTAAGQAALWTREQLGEEDRSFVAALPRVHGEAEFTLAHGSIRDPVWEYLLSAEQALVQFELQQTPYSIIGHSHVPFVFEERAEAAPRLHHAYDGMKVTLGDTRLIANPGSAGQPRDGDPRASYMLYDDGAATLTWHRVDYDIADAQQAILDAGLTPWLAYRLSEGR